MTVFVVEDSDIVRERLIDMLTNLKSIEVIGYAYDSDEAIASIRQYKPDAVILDIQLRNGNGIEVLEDIRKESQVPLLVILTNYPFPQYRKRCLKAGADFFFDKSTEFDRVVEVFEQQLGAGR